MKNKEFVDKLFFVLYDFELEKFKSINSGFFKLRSRLSILLAFLVLYVQGFMFVHLASHGFLPHLHDNKQCEIGLFSDHFNLNKTPDLSLNILPTTYIVENIIIADLAVSKAKYLISSPRSPPLFTV